MNGYARCSLVLALGLALALCFWRANSLADSLFDPAASAARGAGLYAEHPLELAIGDVIKVRVREKTTANVDLSVKSKDQMKGNAKFTNSGGLLGRLLSPVFKLLGEGTLGSDSGTDFKDDGQTDRSTRLDAVVTALVVDKLDNGNVIIEGRKRVLVNKEEQVLLVRGVVDPRDLDKDRAVDSEFIADAEIEYIGEGQLSKRLKPGFLSRVLNALF